MGLHRTGGPPDRRRPRRRGRVPVAFAAIVALVGVTIVTLRIVAANASGCSGAIALRVAATPEIAPVLESVGAAWLKTRPTWAAVHRPDVDKVPAPTMAAASPCTRGGPSTWRPSPNRHRGT